MSKTDEITRRQFMVNAAQSYLGVSLIPMLGTAISTPAFAQGSKGGNQATAKSVIYLNMNGGMSHLDTFDLKPKADREEIQGPTQELKTNVDGASVSSNLEGIAGIRDKMCVINSMTSTQGAHEQGQYLLHKNYNPRGTTVHPSLGSWVLKLGGRINESIPGYVAVRTGSEYTSGGFFGASYSAAPIGSPDEGLQNVDRYGSVSKDDFDARLSLAAKMNAEFHNEFNQQQVEAYDGLYDEAVSLMRSEDLVAFDLSKEDRQTRDQYGRNHFGQGCLLARRLVGHGVRFVEITLSGWDSHYDNFAAVEARSKTLDKAYTALIKDLEKHGLLDSTIVALNTEFGRTPDIVKHHNNGRDHHPAAFSAVLAGGGIKGGTTYGETDRIGRKVSDKPVTHRDFNTTIGYALGLDVEKTLYSPDKRPFTLTGKDNTGHGEPIKELFG